MNQAHIFESSKNTGLNGSEAIIVLPDIYCQTDYAKRTVEEFAEEFGQPVFLVDYFSIYTKEANTFNENDREKVHDLMVNFKGDEFVSFFGKVLGEIKEAHPKIQRFSVVGFCFGGRLSYVAGGEKDVVNVISFYGSGANTANYVQGKTPVEYLVSKRTGDDLKVNSFFGINDPTILEYDRKKIKDEFNEAGIAYEPHEYDAGHAYFQEGRKNFNELASKASWEVLRSIFK